MSHKCNSCEKEFNTYESMKQHAEAAHTGGQPATQSSQPRAAIKIPWYVPVLVVIIIAIAAFVILKPSTPQQISIASPVPTGEQADYWTEAYPFGTDPNLHWHAYPSFKLCGEEKTMLQILGMVGTKFVNGMTGPHVMHVHDGEPWFHIESPPATRKDITLAAGFKAINVPFSNNGILTYQGANGCNDNKTNSLKVSVDGKLIEDPENLVMQDGQKILVDYS